MRAFEVDGTDTVFGVLLQQVEAGEDVTITRGEVPVARLVPLDDDAGAGPRRLDFVSYSLPDSFFDPLPEDELELYE